MQRTLMPAQKLRQLRHVGATCCASRPPNGYLCATILDVDDGTTLRKGYDIAQLEGQEQRQEQRRGGGQIVSQRQPPRPGYGGAVAKALCEGG